MIVLGLGSNIGDRLSHLRAALKRLRQLPALTIKQISPIYQSEALLPENAPPDWNQPYLNCAISADTSLSPHDLLVELKKIEWSIGRKPEKRHWGPRILDIDILVFHNEILRTDALTVPHENLLERPFALWPLADVYPEWVCPLPHFSGQTVEMLIKPWGSRFDGRAPFRTTQIPHRIDTAALMGILNITPDSFSDGGLFLNSDLAIEKAKSLVHQGAEILDIGAESTAPHATPITPEEERKRLSPILQPLIQAKKSMLIPPIISLDTHHVETAAWALQLGVDWINDQSGLSDPAMVALLADTSHDVVIMHQLGLPARRDTVFSAHENVPEVVSHWAAAQLSRLEKNGINPERIILDPGIGFGTSPLQSLSLIRQIHLLTHLGARVLVGHSRKSFFSELTPYPAKDRDIETTAMAPFLSEQGVNYLRVHNVDMCARLFRIMSALHPIMQTPSQTNP